MKLTEVKVRNLKAKDKPYKVSDGHGLYIQITPTGSKYWRYKYRFQGEKKLEEKVLALGIYPLVTLAEARTKQIEARKLLNNDTDPGIVKKYKKRDRQEAAQNSFEALAREWHANFLSKWTQKHAKTIMARLEKNIFPWLGGSPISQIAPKELLTVIRRIEERGANETAHRILQSCGQVFLYAIRTGRAENNPTESLKGALAPTVTKHHASITDPIGVGELLRAINGYKGFFHTRCAFKLAPMLFLRPGELRSLEWDFVSIDSAEIRLPAEIMKMRTIHIVPLSTQALNIFKELQPLTGHGRYVFPSILTTQKPMSPNTILKALRSLGYTGEQMSGHGFRSTACTLLNERGWNKDAIERQLSHQERDKVRAAYNYAEYLPERRKMMQEWSDYLDHLSTVI